MRSVLVTLPLVTVSGDNRHVVWQRKAATAKAQRGIVALALGARCAWEWPVVVTLTRVSPRPLDSDGLHSALKAVQDGVARWLGVDDGRAERAQQVLWLRHQERGGVREHAVRIEIRPLREADGLRGLAEAHPIVGALLRSAGWS